MPSVVTQAGESCQIGRESVPDESLQLLICATDEELHPLFWPLQTLQSPVIGGDCFDGRTPSRNDMWAKVNAQRGWGKLGETPISCLELLWQKKGTSSSPTFQATPNS